jgi:hypothetical protein
LRIRFQLVCEVVAGIGIAVVIGRGHRFAAMGRVARGLDEGGADTLVSFRRIRRPAVRPPLGAAGNGAGLSRAVLARRCGGCTILLYRHLQADLLREG